MAKLDILVAFAFGYCISDYIEKDYALKPVFCTLACSIASYYSVKVTAEGAGAIYDTIVKPTLKTLLAARAVRNMNGINGLPPVPNIAERIRNNRF